MESARRSTSSGVGRITQLLLLTSPYQVVDADQSRGLVGEELEAAEQAAISVPASARDRTLGLVAIALAGPGSIRGAAPAGTRLDMRKIVAWKVDLLVTFVLE